MIFMAIRCTNWLVVLDPQVNGARLAIKVVPEGLAFNCSAVILHLSSVRTSIFGRPFTVVAN